MLKYKIVATVSARAVAAGAASADVVREIPARTQTVPAKPMMVRAILHAPALRSAHSPANGPVHIKTIGSAHQAAQLARRDRLVREHLPLVKAIAIRVRGSVPVQVDQDDLVHAGILGLIDAANKFNPEKQGGFSSYAKYRIRGAILDSLRQLHWTSRDMRHAAQAR
jgi:DNA-directed RNA polymerase sigma subunit (sigma70/sigma32)